MKKITLTLLSFTLAFSMFAGGLVTNTNQSAAWSRMLVRDASTDIDAAYFNPAGLTKLADGFHLSISNQTIGQVRTIRNSFLDKSYDGKTFAPIFPNLYAVYKTGKLAFSFGFMGIGGGGSAEFTDGLAMIDLMVATLPSDPLIIAAAGQYGAVPTGASRDTAIFEGSSIYFGYQAGISYAINDMISLYVGGRYVSAKNTTEGSITGIQVVTDNPAVVIPIPNFYIDAEQTGSGFTPIIGTNLSFMEDKVNIGIKYEFKTSLELTNKTTTDDLGMFPDGEAVNADMPAMLSVGLGYQLSDALYATFGFHTFFDTQVDWENVDQIDGNSMEYALGLEYALNEKLLISGGWLFASSNVKDTFHSELSYASSSNTFAIGGAYRINDMLKLQLGGYNMFYNDFTINHVGYNQTYDKTTWGIAVGLDFTFGGN